MSPLICVVSTLELLDCYLSLLAIVTILIILKSYHTVHVHLPIDGAAYALGRINGDTWYLYTACEPRLPAEDSDQTMEVGCVENDYCDTLVSL